MQTILTKSTISSTYEDVRSFSYEEKKNLVDSEKFVNDFLDGIIEFRKFISEKTDVTNEIIDRLERLTWLNRDDATEEDYMALNDLIAACRDLKSTLLRFYASTRLLRDKGIAINELREFKASIDDLREMYEDLEDVFFHLPAMPDFQETTKKLASL